MWHAKLGNPPGAAPLGEAYLRLLVEEFKPFIDRQYRTRAQREQTVVIGSSMGGLVRPHRLYFDHDDQTLDALYGPFQQRMDAIAAEKGFPKGWTTGRALSLAPATSSSLATPSDRATGLSAATRLVV